LPRGRNHCMWLPNPDFWAASLVGTLAPHRAWLSPYVTTTLELTGQIAIQLMLFGLGVRLSQDRIENLGLALRINVLYLLAGVLTLPIVLWLLPLTPECSRMIALSVLLPPAVRDYLLCEQYRAGPSIVASVVLLGNVL